MAKKLHILFLSNWFPSRVKPTSGDFVQRHAEAVATKHKVTVLHAITDDKLKSNIEIEVSTQNNIMVVIGYIKKFKNPLVKFFYFIKVYKKCLQEVDVFDIAHLNVTYPKGIVALYLKWFKKIPFIITEHWTGYLYPQNKSIGNLEKFISKLIIKSADYVCPVSNTLGKQMIELGFKGNYFTVGNVINTDNFIPAKKEDRPFTITHISALQNTHKNISGMLETIKQLSNIINNFIFVIVGNSNHNEIESIIKKLEIPKANIHLLAAQTQKQLAQILQQSDVYVSFSNYETFGIVMTESIACGCPVISTNTGILHELGASGFYDIIPINDQNLLLKKLLEYSNNPKKLDVNKMYQFIDNLYSTEKISCQFSELYYKCLEN
ncbi:MAG: glycosyltransferase family 4 protein [Urechidicola sp.]|nr:glycosyltransferase family 4 protein [Urechidicola sp.]